MAENEDTQTLEEQAQAYAAQTPPQQQDFVDPKGRFAAPGQTVTIGPGGTGLPVYSPFRFTPLYDDPKKDASGKVTSFQTRPFEAVLGEKSVTLDPFPFSGAAFITNRKNLVDNDAAYENAIVTATEAFKANNVDIESDEFRKMIMRQTGYYQNPRGTEATNLKPIPFVFPEGEDTFENRMLALDRNRAQSIYQQFDNPVNPSEPLISTTPVPYSAITKSLVGNLEAVKGWEKANLPKFGLDRSEGANSNSVFVQDRFFGGVGRSIKAMFDDETAAQMADESAMIFASKFVNWAEKNNFDERDIAGVLKHRLTLPVASPGTQFLAYGEQSLLRSALTESFRFGAEAILYLAGEGLDAINLWNDEVKSDLFTRNYDISDPAHREAILERWFPSRSKLVQDQYDALNLDLDFAGAERVANFYTSAPGTLVGVAMNVKAAGQLDKFRKTLSANSERKLFNKFIADQRILFPGSSEDEIIMKYKEMRRKQAFGFTFNLNTKEIHDKILKAPIVGAPTSAALSGASTVAAFINGVRTSNRLVAGMQLEEATLRVHARPEVRRFIAYGSGRKKDRAAIYDRAKQEQRSLTVPESIDVKILDKEIDAYRTELRLMLAETSVPKYMRSEAGKALARIGRVPGTKYDLLTYSGGLDQSVILTAATASSVASVYGGDTMLWEFFGSAGGLLGYSLRKTPGGAIDFTNQVMRGEIEFINPLKNRGKFLNREVRLAGKLVNQLGAFDDEFRAGVMERIRYHDNLKQELVRDGVGGELLERSAGRIMGLTILQTIEEGLRVSLDAPGAAQFNDNVAKALQENRNAQDLLLNDLRGVFVAIENVEGYKDADTPIGRLYDTVKAAIDNGEAKVQQLDTDIERLNIGLEDYLYGIISSTSSVGMQRVMHEADDALPELINRLTGEGISFLSVPAAQKQRRKIERVAQGSMEAIANEASQIATRVLPSTEEARRRAGTILNDAGEAPKNAADLPVFETSADLFALSLETLRISANKKTGIPFQQLGGQPLQTLDGTPVNVAFADGGGIFDEISRLLGKGEDATEFLQALNPNNVSDARMNKFFQTLDDISEGVIQTAAARAGEDVRDFVRKMENRAKASTTLSIDDRLPKNLGIVAFMRADSQQRGRKVNAFALNPSQLMALDEGIGFLANQAKNAQRDRAAFNYNNIRFKVGEAMQNFVVEGPDGKVPAGDLYVTITLFNDQDVRMKFRDALKKANEERSYHYHGKFNDPVMISTWMGTKTTKGNPRVAIPATAQHPMGMSYGQNPPSTWLDINTWTKKDINAADRDVKILEAIYGVEQPDGTNIVDLSTKKGAAFQTLLAATYRENLMKYINDPRKTKQSYAEFNDKIRRFEAMFTGVDKKGNKVYLIDTDNEFRKIYGAITEETVGLENVKESEKLMRKLAKRNAANINRQAKLINQGRREAINFLRRYTTEELDANRVADILIQGGPRRIAELRTRLQRISDIKDEEVDMILRDVLASSMTEKVFKATGQYIPVLRKSRAGPDRIVQRYEFDLNALQEFMGANNPDVALATRQILGDKDYNTFTNIMKFMAEEQQKLDRGMRLTGIPREFSVESYISRIYALQRQVVSFRYVGTEAILQSYRNNNMSLLTEMIRNPRVGEYMLRIIRTGKPLPFEQEKDLQRFLIIGLERYKNTGAGTRPEKWRFNSGIGHELQYGPETIYDERTQPADDIIDEQELLKRRQAVGVGSSFPAIGSLLSSPPVQEGARKLFGDPINREE